MKSIYIFLLLGLSFASCKNQKPATEENDLTSAVMEVHDEVMPKIGNINSASRKLRATLETIDDSVGKRKMILCIKDLKEAEEGMMVWMEEWSVPKTEPEKTTYLKNEMIRIQKVKNDINSSLKLSSELLEQYTK